MEGATLLLAVPGSGKTTVLIHRLGYMVKVCGIDPTSILTVTYTTAATEEMKLRGLMDYDDQLSYALIVLEKCPTVLSYFQDKFRYIGVDESQDISKIQHEIIRLLASKYGNLFMVGDEDQSIR